jgi:DNA-binding PadR family transcriptional regulator
MNDSIAGNSLRGHLETMVLSVLERQPAHGFELLRRLELVGCGSLKMKEGSLYPALYRMEERGLIKGRWEAEAAERRGPRRRIYSLTGKGKRQLQAGRRQWAHFVAVIGGIVGAPA